MRILIIDDDELLCESLQTSLKSDNYIVDTATDSEKGSFLARTNDYDLVVLDNMMPRKSGLKVCQEIRAAGKTMPIIMLSSQTSVSPKIAVLDHGADDYLNKPFSYGELRARIRALLRRPKEIEPQIMTIDNLTIDSNKQKVSRGTKDIYLTRKEFALLEYLMRNKGNVVSRAMILEHVWSIDADPFSNTIEAHILNLRKKIEAGKKRKLIHNIPGRGYKLDTEK